MGTQIDIREFFPWLKEFCYLEEVDLHGGRK